MNLCADARAEGFESRLAFLDYFWLINGQRPLDGRKCFAVEFRLEAHQDQPAAGAGGGR